MKHSQSLLFLRLSQLYDPKVAITEPKDLTWQAVRLEEKIATLVRVNKILLNSSFNDIERALVHHASVEGIEDTRATFHQINQ